MLVSRPLWPSEVCKFRLRSLQKNLLAVYATGREQAEARAFQRFLKNRVKQLGTFLPPGPDAPEPDTALLWSFLSRQLEQGISNKAEVLPRAEVASSRARHTKSTADGQHARTGRRGVVIAQPRPLPDIRRTESCPMPTWAPAAVGSSGSSAGSSSASTHTALVHIFWDVESAHPGDRDPRLVAVEVLRLAGRLGRVVGSYAYATRQAWAWVPSYFLSMNTQDPEGMDDRNADGTDTGRGAGGVEALRPLPSQVRCPVCGKPLTASKLERHLRTLHPDKPAAAAVATAQEEALKEPLEASAAAGAVRGGAAAARKNSYRTGLGAIREYYSSSGALFRPPAGHQLGLKYVLQREGFEPRVAQNADDASDRALNGGIDRLLAALRAGTTRAAATAVVGSGGRGPLSELQAAELPHTLVLVSGSRRHAAGLISCRRLGVKTVVVAAAPRVVEEPGQADLLLSWELLAGGAYRI